MNTTNFGPWTTSLDDGSRLELSAFWRGRMLRLATVAAGDVASLRRKVSALGPMLVAAALFPMFRPGGASVAGIDEIPPSVATEPAVEDAPPIDAPPVSDPPQFALSETPVSDVPKEPQGDRDLQKALRAAVAYLSASQRDDGSWSQDATTYRIGMTSLGALALAQSGVKPTDLRLRKAAEFLRGQKPLITYELALQTVALCALEPKRDAALIQQNVVLLEETQLKEGPSRGGWSYGRGGPQGAGDGSNTDFAIWGLDAAANAGANVRRETWEAALHYWLDRQLPNGGWTYSGGPSATGSMTTAGIASVAACLAHLTSDDRKPSEAEQKSIDRGLAWMTKHFAAGHNPGGGQWLLYYAVMFRRAADATKFDRLGEHDWRREFAEYLLSQQNRTLGSWIGPGIEGNPVLGTSFVILALVGADPKPR